MFANHERYIAEAYVRVAHFAIRTGEDRHDFSTETIRKELEIIGRVRNKHVGENLSKSWRDMHGAVLRIDVVSNYG